MIQHRVSINLLLVWSSFWSREPIIICHLYMLKIYWIFLTLRIHHNTATTNESVIISLLRVMTSPTPSYPHSYFHLIAEVNYQKWISINVRLNNNLLSWHFFCVWNLREYKPFILIGRWSDSNIFTFADHFKLLEAFTPLCSILHYMIIICTNNCNIFIIDLIFR